MPEKINVICIAGPTASGKTSLAVDVALRVGGEVVSADSMQIYRGMDIGTAKPTRDEMRGVPHHMIDIVEIGTDYTVAMYVRQATDVIKDIAVRGKIPIVTGGTGLYIGCLFGQMSFGQAKPDYEYREKLQEIAQKDGRDALYAMLLEKDPESAQKLHPNDVKRVARALEILNSANTTKGSANSSDSAENPLFNPAMFCLMPSQRQMLYDRINTRVDGMMEHGLVEEARALMPKLSATSAQAIGYKELFLYFNGQCTLFEATEKIKMETRRYAKRQITWFKRDARMNFLLFDKEDDLTRSVLNRTRQIWNSV